MRVSPEELKALMDSLTSETLSAYQVSLFCLHNPCMSCSRQSSWLFSMKKRTGLQLGGICNTAAF